MSRQKVGAGFPFDRRTGDGEVKALCGQYTKGVEAGYNVEPLLFETFGGFAPPTAQLFYYAYELRQKFSTSEYDENTWATRTWLAFVTQQVSVALHKAVAREVKRGCVVGSGDTCDVRGKWVGSEGDEGEHQAVRGDVAATVHGYVECVRSGGLEDQGYHLALQSG